MIHSHPNSKLTTMFSIPITMCSGRKLAMTLSMILCAQVSPGMSLVPEPLGPSSRRTPIAISEIMCKPAARADGLNTEFVELYNSNPWPEDISRWRLSGDIQFTFPEGSSVPGLGFLVVAAAPADVSSVYSLATAVGPYTNSLKTSGTIRLHSEINDNLLEVNYSDMSPWPAGTDGTGHSLVLARASYGENDPRAWERSPTLGGSPEAADAFSSDALANVLINEVLAHTDPPLEDGVELYNHTIAVVNLSGCTLSDDPATNKYTFPAGTTIPARGFRYFTGTQLGFNLNAAGESLFLRRPDGRILDAIKFGPQENGVSLGRYPNGSDGWIRLDTVTAGASNSPPRLSPVGFNEIMFNPISGEDDDQYLELYNPGTHPVSLAGWKLVSGVSFAFPSNAIIASKGFLVVARNTSRLLTKYPQLNATNLVGNFSGKLSHSGERLALSMPDTLVGTNAAGVITTNRVDIVVDEVTYGTGGRWGRWADGGGSSLELRDPRSDKRLASNWADSDESGKSAWATVESTGMLDNGLETPSALHLGLLEAGECLVDNVAALDTNGVNCALNAGFENGTLHWTFQGDHLRSSVENGSGYPASGSALHLRVSDGIQMYPNLVSGKLTNSPFASGSVATLRFKARWLKGCPEPLLRFSGNWLEATARLPLPSNLGTPGLPNSCAVTNAPPAIYEILHNPPIPAASQAVVVSARASDPDGLDSLVLSYRYNTTVTSVVMNDSGTSGDTVAGDGIYSGIIWGYQSGAGVDFWIVATDRTGATNRFPALLDDSSPLRECTVRFGEPNPSGGFGCYHLWLSQSNVTRWTSRPVMSNEDIDGTLVYNNRIIYNMSGRYSGSPWHQNFGSPASPNACHFVWTMPKDDRLLGFSSFNKIHWPGNDIQRNDDPTLQREQAAYLLLRGAGVPWMNRRFVAVFVNGTRKGKLMEDALRPTAGNIHEQYFSADSRGHLFKIQRWYPRGTDAGLYSECLMKHYTTTGGAKKVARYRPCWSMKESPGSLSDFSDVFALIDAANTTNASFIDVLESVVDMDNWLRVSAANHAADNWDCFGAATGQNMDAWVGDRHRWSLFIIDLSICLDIGYRLPLIASYDPAWVRIMNTPKYRRIYFQALNELANGIMLPEKINPIMDAKYAAFTTYLIGTTSPTDTKTKIASQRSLILAAVATNNAAVFSIATNTWCTTSNAITLTGLAPLPVSSIRINGSLVSPRWTSVNGWSVLLPVVAGTNSLLIEALDREGNVIGDAIQAVTQNDTIPESPVDNVVFSEIMFNPAFPDGEYVELLNRATNTTFDLSGWQINGLSYTFPSGAVIAPNQRILLAASRTACAAAYGVFNPPFDQFDGSLQNNGETLTLIQPGTPPGADRVVDRVHYESTLPWPAAALQTPGTALQLMDAAQDNSRVANWSTGRSNAPVVELATPGRTNSVATIQSPFPSIWLNEVQPENITGPTDNRGEREPWIELFNSGTESVSLDGLFLGIDYANPACWAFPPDAQIAPGAFLVVWADGQTSQSAGAIHTSFKPSPNQGSIILSRLTNGVPQVLDYLNYTALAANYSYGSVPDGQPFYRQSMYRVTPGATNNAALPPISVSINEWMADNVNTRMNPATGKYDDWFEIYNPSAVPAPLAGCYLTDALTNVFQFQIPAGYSVPPGGFLLVWADGKTSANSTNNPDLHVPFKLDKAGEAIGLFTPDGTAIDVVVFGPQSFSATEGRYPDGGTLRLMMSSPSPGAPNILPPIGHWPEPINVALSPDQSVTMSFQTSPGHTYRVEYKDNLSDAVWLPLGGSHFATSAALLVSDFAGTTQRYYRVTLVE
jgi:hypothetical protein